MDDDTQDTTTPQPAPPPRKENGRGAPGRPLKLTPQVQEIICDAISKGAYYESACAQARIAYHSFTSWMARGRKERDRIASSPRTKPRDEERVYLEFMEAVEAAQTGPVNKALKTWMKAIETDENWIAARDFLARRYPREWAPQGHGSQVNTSVNLGGVTITEVLVELPGTVGESSEEEFGPGEGDLGEGSEYSAALDDGLDYEV